MTKNKILIFSATYNEAGNIENFLNSIEKLNLLCLFVKQSVRISPKILSDIFDKKFIIFELYFNEFQDLNTIIHYFSTKRYTSTFFQPKWIKEIVIRILEIIKRWIRL